MKDLIEILMTAQFIHSIFRVTTPILFATLGAVIADRAGVPNIALEGIMLIAAFCGVFGSAATHSALAGLGIALLSGLICAAVLALFTLYYHANVILGGIAINSLASGGTVFFLYLFTGDKGSSSSIASGVLPDIQIPLLNRIPFLGAVLSGQNVLTYLAFLSIIFVAVLLGRTALGSHIKAVGENEKAAESVGINVNRTRFIAFLISGVLVSFGGAFMSMGYVSMFSRDMISGRGWIAVAAEAMGGANPVPCALAAMAFGFFNAVATAASTVGWASSLVQTIPYVATLLGLLLFAVRETRLKKKG